MKAKFVGFASFTRETGGGILVSIYFPNLLIFGWVLVVIGILSLIFGLTWKRVYKYSGLLMKSIKSIFRIIIHPKISNELLNLMEIQKLNPENWLNPVIEYIDLNRQGTDYNNNDVYIKFQIDNHLLNQINECYTFVKLYLAIPDSSRSTESNWYEVKTYLPITRLERHNFTSYPIRIKGETSEEKTLLDWMKDFRNGKPLLANLKIGVKFRKDDKPIDVDLKVLKTNGIRFMMPANDYRME